MATEFEKKYRLTEKLYEDLAARLADIGAHYEGEEEEENTIFELTALIGKPAVLRIRSVGDKTLLTFKRRLASDTGVKHQIEFETEVSDRAAVSGIIGELGLAPNVIYEKRRRTWRLADVEVVLDTLPFGLFMEIEGPIESIAEAERKLSIENLPVEARTYPNLTAELGKRVGDIIEARFEK